MHQVLQRVAPDLPAAWWDRWSPDAPQSCRLPQQPLQQAQVQAQAQAQQRVPADAAASAAGRAADSAGSGGGGGGGAPCSMATLFLQHYLDSLGALNTFG